MKESKICAHCSKSIQWDDVFGWYHGDIQSGWNTSCADDDNRAIPTDWIEPDEVNHIWQCNKLYGPVMQVELDRGELVDVQPVIEKMFNETHPADHQHNFRETHTSPTGKQVYHICPGM